MRPSVASLRFLRRAVIYALLAALLLYASVCGLLWALQDRMVFPGAGLGDRGVPTLQPAPVVEWLDVAGGVRTRLAVLPASAPRAVVLYLGGNGEDLYAAVGSAAQLAAHGAEAIAAEYPGYGASAGAPSVASLLATAQAAAAHARRRAQALGVPLVVVGSSLGSFGAMQVAADGTADRLVLRAPPTSLVDAGAAAFPWLPVRMLLRHQFDNMAVAPRVRCPTLVLHGDRDRIVPDRFGRALAAAIAGAVFVPVPGHGHNDIDLSPAGPVAAAVRAAIVGR